jgi:hypothetical protein
LCTSPFGAQFTKIAVSGSEKVLFVCLYFMNVGQLQLSSGNSSPISGNNHHLTIPFEYGVHSFKRCVCKGKNTGRPSVTEENEFDYRVDVCRIIKGAYIERL